MLCIVVRLFLYLIISEYLASCSHADCDPRIQLSSESERNHNFSVITYLRAENLPYLLGHYLFFEPHGTMMIVRRIDDLSAGSLKGSSALYLERRGLGFGVYPPEL